MKLFLVFVDFKKSMGRFDFFIFSSFLSIEKMKPLKYKENHSHNTFLYRLKLFLLLVKKYSHVPVVFSEKVAK